MQSFRKNGVFNFGFWVAAGVFAALAGFDRYHNPGGGPPYVLLIAAAACAVAALWGRGNLLTLDSEHVRFNMGLLNRKKLALTNVKKVKIESEKYVHLHIRGAAVNSVKISLALLHPDDRERFMQAMQELATKIEERDGED